MLYVHEEPHSEGVGYAPPRCFPMVNIGIQSNAVPLAEISR
jgi:hypothetical protein